MNNRVALVIGATGLVGQQLVNQLLQDQSYQKIVTFTRRPLPELFAHPKIEQHIVDFDDIDAWAELIQGDVLFCCIGTTLKKAGSKAAQTVIDLDYPSLIADKARRNGVEQAVVVSSIGAGKPGASFYLSLKHKLEAHFKALQFERLSLLRPSVLVGDRAEFRMGERIGIGLLTLIWPLPFIRKYRPIKGEQVAKALIHFSKHQPKGVLIIENPDLFI